MGPFFRVKLHALEAKDASKLSEEVEKSCMEELDNSETERKETISGYVEEALICRFCRHFSTSVTPNNLQSQAESSSLSIFLWEYSGYKLPFPTERLPTQVWRQEV
ncbi:hypothetical protein AAG906_022963 [Vitis piasezkii]